MDLDRGVLARIDRKLLASLGGDETFRMVRVPTTPAMWSTWKRYCDAAGIPIGRAVVALIAHELSTVIGESEDAAAPLLAGRTTEELAAREAQVDARERNVAAEAHRLRGWDEQLRTRDTELLVREQRLELTAKPARQHAAAGKVGRNEHCPCGSGLKYKRCHGVSGHRT